MIFLGYLGDYELAAGSISIAFANITGYSVLKGLATGMEPISCQAYRANKWAILGQTYKKTLCLLLLISIPISLLWLNMEQILLGLGQDQSITSVARAYITYSIPELFVQAHLYPLRNFLKGQNIIRPLIMSASCALILHPLINYFLVIYLNLGLKGVALASAWNSLNINLGLLVYLFLSQKPLKPWDEVENNTSPEGLQPLLTLEGSSAGWQPLLALAGASLLSVCLEEWWYDMMLILCGLLSNPRETVAAMGILIQTRSLFYVFSSSLSAVLTTLVGHDLGGNQPVRAQQKTFIGLIVAAVWGVLAFAFTLAVKDLWGKLYTGDVYILSLTSIALPILGLCEIWNCPQTAAGGILPGSAQRKMCCYINFASFYLIGQPIAALKGIQFKMGFVGLWLGHTAAQFSCMCMMAYALFHTNWKHQARMASELIQATEGQENDLEADS